MMPDATARLDTRGRLARNLDGSTGRPDVEALLDMIAARMSGDNPQNPNMEAKQSALQGQGDPGLDEQATGAYPGHGLSGLHPDDLLELAQSLSGQEAPQGLMQNLGQKLLAELMRQGQGAPAGLAGWGAGQSRQTGTPAHAGILGNPALARRLAMNDPLFDRVFPLVKSQIASLPAFFRNFVRGHVDREPTAFSSVYAETRRKYQQAKDRAGKDARRGAPVLEESGAGDPPIMGDRKQARIEELTRKIKQNRGSAHDFGEILELSGVLDRMNR
jgi:hypothetical protein